MTAKNNAEIFRGAPEFSVFGLALAGIIKTAFCILAGLMLSVPAASAQEAYAMEFNQGNNLFGSVNLTNGNFTELGSEGGSFSTTSPPRRTGRCMASSIRLCW